MPSFSRLAAKAKAHHESLNAAYATYYGAHTPSSSAASSPSASPRQSMESTSSAHASVERSGSMTKAWESVKKAAKDHHEGLNAAYATYYGQGSSTAPSRSHSTVSSEAVANDSEAKKAGVWEKVVKKAKVHHQSVNSAYAAVYGHI